MPQRSGPEDGWTHGPSCTNHRLQKKDSTKEAAVDRSLVEVLYRMDVWSASWNYQKSTPPPDGHMHIYLRLSSYISSSQHHVFSVFHPGLLEVNVLKH